MRAVVVTILATIATMLVPAAAVAGVPQGYLGNGEPCAGAPAAGVPLYSTQFQLHAGYYGLELRPVDYPANASRRLERDRIVLTLPHFDERFATVVYDDSLLVDGRLYVARRSDLCIADAGSDPRVTALAAGRPVPDLLVSDHAPVDAARLALVVEHMSHIPASVREAVDSRGGYGLLFGGDDITAVPGYEHWRSFELMGPYADGRSITDVDGLSIGPRLNAGFGATVDRESATESVALHEFGHVYDYATGKSLQPDFLLGPQVEAQQCAAHVSDSASSYFTGNPLEWYAESFSQYLLDPARNANLKARCPQTWSFHRYWMGTPAFG